MPEPPTALHESLRLTNPGVHWDPATYLLRDQLDQASLHDLAMVQLDHQKAIAQAHINSIEKAQAILSKSAGKAKSAGK